jgi:quinol monooxygenase YgiN
MILTVLEASVAPERAADLLAAFRAAEAEIPPGLVRSELICSVADASHWRIETLWADRAALDAMRQAGTPAGVLMFRSAGAEPTLSVFDVQASIPSGAG